MKKIFILGGSHLQLDLILEAKRMFFYTIVLDMDKNCIGSNWCDEFLAINIADKEDVLKKAQEYQIDMILTSATELGNITACWVGEQLGLYTNSYQTALNTTDKKRMKGILLKNNLPTSKYSIVNKDEIINWKQFPCIVKPSDSSAGRGLSYCTTRSKLEKAIGKASTFSPSKNILIEEYIEGQQYSIETISCDGIHQIIAINSELIHDLPHIIETGHIIPAIIKSEVEDSIRDLLPIILNAFAIQYGACHIELRVDQNNKISIIELASRTGGMRSEMISLAYGINYSQLLILAALNYLPELRYSRNSTVNCHFVIDYNSYQKYLDIKNNKDTIIFEPVKIREAKKDFIASHLGESKGYYFVINIT